MGGLDGREAGIAGRKITEIHEHITNHRIRASLGPDRAIEKPKHYMDLEA